MNEIEQLLKITLAELKTIVSAKTTIGDPITFEGVTIIPVIKASFGFGTGGGGKKSSNDGAGGGTGAGGKITPVALVVIDENGVRLVSVDKDISAAGGPTSAIDKILDVVKSVLTAHDTDDPDKRKEAGRGQQDRPLQPDGGQQAD